MESGTPAQEIETRYKQLVFCYVVDLSVCARAVGLKLKQNGGPFYISLACS